MARLPLIISITNTKFSAKNTRNSNELSANKHEHPSLSYSYQWRLNQTEPEINYRAIIQTKSREIDSLKTDFANFQNETKKLRSEIQQTTERTCDLQRAHSETVTVLQPSRRREPQSAQISVGYQKHRCIPRPRATSSNLTPKIDRRRTSSNKDSNACPPNLLKEIKILERDCHIAI